MNELKKKMNMLLIVVDQLAWKKLNNYGGKSNTPNIDSIAENGVAMDACYCPYPLCQPSRAAFWTGMDSHRNQVWSNGRNWQITEVDETFPCLGETFRNAGYKTMHFGKRHDGGALRGFECSEELLKEIPDENPAFPFNFDTYADAYTVDRAKEFLESYDFEKPLFMALDIINPHNICGYIGKNKGVHENAEGTGDVDTLPELPENFYCEDLKNRPLPVQYLCCSHVRQSQTVGWTEDNFRGYLAAYDYYLSVADRHIGEVIDALRKTGELDNTMIVFWSDHGDNMTSRQSVTKQVTMYEEVTRVPLIFSGAGVTPRKETVKGLCSLLDIYPTLCSIAGIEAPEGLDGKDISEVITTGKLPERRYVTSEWFTEWGYTISPGRMVRTERYKYIHYLEGNGEELYDLEKDPHEMKNVAADPSYADVLQEARDIMKTRIEESDDPYYSLEVKADRRWRSHEIGYQNHRGITAPEYKED